MTKGFENDSVNYENDIDVQSISTDTVDGNPEINGLECISCNERGHTIPVWEDIIEYFKGEPPDYVGCTNCHTMHPTTGNIIADYYVS